MENPRISPQPLHLKGSQVEDDDHSVPEKSWRTAAKLGGTNGLIQCVRQSPIRDGPKLCG